MKNKFLLPIVIFLILLIAGGGYFLFARNQSSTVEEEQSSFFDEDAIPLDPSEIGLEIVPRSDGKAVKLVLNKATDIQTIEFDIVYEADLAGGSDEDGGVGRVTRNVTDELEVDGESPFETKYYDLGSCSSGRCRYDTGVTEVQVIMKVVKTDGTIYQVEDTQEL